jgi:alpha-tubulin suppressor-like RCC1 family protein
MVSVAGGQSFSLALKSDGTVWAWGANAAGQLGNGTHDSIAHATASQVEGVGGNGFLSGVSGIAGGAGFAVVVQGTGGVLAWEQGNAGQLGNNASQTKTTPILVAGVGGSGTLGGQTLIAVGNAHALAIATTRTITTSYGYDNLYRLTSGGTPGTPNSYTNDPVGNRLNPAQGSASPVFYTHGEVDRTKPSACGALRDSSGGGPGNDSVAGGASEC